MAFKLLYVEEQANTFSNYLIDCHEIELVLIRFATYCHFTEEYLRKTNHIPTFYIDRRAGFEEECERLRIFLDGCGKIDYFYNDSEFNQQFIQHVASHLGLPGALSDKQAAMVRDKAVMKTLLNSLNIKCQDYAIVNDIDEVRQYLEKRRETVILKARDGFSSINVFKINNIECLDSLNINLFGGKFIVEEYNPNKIWCIDSVVTDGEIVCNLYTWLPFTNLSFAEKKEKFIQLAVGEKPHNWKFNPMELTQKIVSGIGLDRGYLHLEAFIGGNGEPSVCEYAWRTPGEHMISNLSYVYGVSISEILLHALMGRKDVLPSVENGCVADVFLPVFDGKIDEISTRDDFANIKELMFLDGEVFYKKGDIIHSEHNYTDCSGWVQIKADSIETMMKDVDLIYASFLIKKDKKNE